MLNDFLKRKSIKYYIDCGTLLGAIRENNLIDGDTDADIMVSEDGFLKIKENLNELENIGFIAFRINDDIENWFGLSILRKGEYIGFDPTSDSLHIGSLVPILLLVHLQKAGHKPFALVGGATGMVGDPSGKSEERNLLSEETLQFNQEGVRKQLSKFLDFNSSKTNAAELVNNYDLFKDFSFLNFIRDVGKHITVNYMMQKPVLKSSMP